MVSHMKQSSDKGHDQHYGHTSYCHHNSKRDTKDMAKSRQQPRDSKDGESAASNGDSTKKIPATSKSKTITLVLPRWVYCYLPVALALLAVIVPATLLNHRRYILESTLLESTDFLGWEVVDLFSDFDKDGDFYLNIDEAAPLLLQFVAKSQGKEATLNADVQPGEDVVVVEARFTPVNLSTMTKDWEHDFNNNDSFYGLFNWMAPHIPVKEFGVARFRDLLPQDLDNIPSPGTVYTVVEPPSGMFGYPSLPSNRFYPPHTAGRGYAVQRLLSMFHPHPFVIMRFPPQGIFGCVRAVSKYYIEVVFRMHVEFQLNEPPRFPFWFTPAQFTGSLVMSRNGSSVRHFHLYVPNERKLNVDMEWLNEKDNPESMEVDIGYMPLMELVSIGHSRPRLSDEDMITKNANIQENDEEVVLTDIEWDQEITVQEARDALELKLFPFKEIKYYNLSDAFDHAKEENKLVHSILLWGALDDQSC